MELVQYNLLLRWLIGLSMDDSVWVPTVFCINHQRLIVHTVRGSQYASLSYCALVARHERVASLRCKGNCWDKAMLERFSST